MQRLNPVETPNVRQNTPDIDELNRILYDDELYRHEAGDIEKQVSSLLSQYLKETQPAG